MWSGPRNLSTALMRSFGNRSDTLVVDEPFYAHYLLVTGREHPGRDDIIGHYECDWRKVAASLHAPLPPGVSLHYQKHMSQHLLPTMDRDWLRGLRHAFLLRDPADMLQSLGSKLGTVYLADTGLPQQLEIFERLRTESGATPPVIDADDLLDDPQGMLRALCTALDVPFEAGMLCWPPGPRSTDGIWAKYWYDAVERSSGFQRWSRNTAALSAPLAAVERQARPLYERMHAERLRPLAAAAL